MLTLSLISKLLASVLCWTLCSYDTAQTTEKWWSTLAPKIAFKRKQYKSNQLYRRFTGVRCCWWCCCCYCYSYCCRVLLVYCTTALSMKWISYCGKRCYFHDRQSQTNFIPPRKCYTPTPTPLTIIMLMMMSIARRGRIKCGNGEHMY